MSSIQQTTDGSFHVRAERERLGLGAPAAVPAPTVPATPAAGAATREQTGRIPVTTPMLLKGGECGRLQPRKLVTHRFALDDIMHAYETFEHAARGGR